MAPETRSAAKSSPGRSTRNSIFGRPPPSPPKPRSRSPTKPSTSPVRPAPTHQPDVVDGDVSPTKGTGWLGCRDAHGVMTSIAVSETGEGIHIRWHYPGNDGMDVDNHNDTDVEMSIADPGERGLAPITGPAGPDDAVRRGPFHQTPRPLHPYDAGSVMRTPIKKARPLQPSPPRIGDKGIRCLYQKSGALIDFNGAARVVLPHPTGTTANLSREQVEGLEDKRELDIVLSQAERLLEDKKQMMEEDQFTDSGYEDETQTEISDRSSVLPPDSPDSETGNEGESLDQYGDHRQSGANGLRRARRLGPEGTELIDDDSDD